MVFIISLMGSGMNRIVIVGSNPSRKSSKVIPFWHDTKSSKTLAHWLDEVHFECEFIHFMNVSNLPTEKNRPLKTSEIKANLPTVQYELNKVKPTKIIALGKTAEKALSLLGVDFFPMPHPSGLNRLLNDKHFMEEKIKGLSVYLNPSIES